MSALRNDEGGRGLVVLRDIVTPGSTTRARATGKSKPFGRETAILRVVSVPASQMHTA